jgi:AcrR family transcriptional regulator
MKQNHNLKLSNDEINQLTRNSIQESLVYLLGKKDMDDISVTEIVTKAGVSRSAYYRNYHTKEDILKDFAIHVFHLLFKELNTEENISHPQSWYHYLFSTVKENERIVRLIFRARMISWAQYLPEELTRKYDKKEQYQLVAMMNALIWVTDKWVSNDFDLSVDEISALCFEIFPNIHYLIKK